MLEDGTREEPQVVRVAGMPWNTKMDRRGAIGTGVALAGLIGFLNAGSSELALAAQASRSTQDPPSMPCTTPEGKLAAHLDKVNALAISPEGKVLASASSDRTAKLWSLPDGKLLSTLEGHTNAVLALAVTPDGRIVASGSSDRTVKLWSLPDGKLLSTLGGHTNEVWAITITPDGKVLASAGTDTTIRLWSLPDGKLLATLEGHTEWVCALAVTPDGNVLASGSTDGTVKLWSLSGGKLLATLKGHGAIGAMAITPDGKLLASAGADTTIRLWSLSGGKLLATLKGPKGWVSALAVTPDGSVLASGDDDQTIRLWSLSDSKLLANLDAHTAIGAMAITPDGSILVSGGADNTVALWSLPLALNRGSCFRSYLFDPKATADYVKGVTYNVYDSVTGRTVTYTLPCGSAIPNGAVCTCNCVPGTHLPAGSSGGYSGGSGGCYTVGTVCQCNKICTCVPVPSSLRWKDNIQILQGALDQAMHLRGVRFDWTSDAPHHPAKRSDIGLIAEEVAKVVPEVVNLDENGAPRSVDYARLTALLVEAVKTQQTQIEQLKTEVRDLKVALLPELQV